MDHSNFTLPTQPMDPEQIAAIHEEIMARNMRRHHERVATVNRRAGIPAPQPGDVLYVTPARGIKARSRSGLRFDENKRSRVIVVDDAFGVTAPDGSLGVVDVNGAEAILADDALTTHATSAADADASAERAARERAEAEVKRLEASNAALRAEIAAARRNAPDPGDGSPGRLRAAARVRATKAGSDDDFGGGAG